MTVYHAMPVVKCVVLGDGAVGKTCLLISYAENRFADDHVPTVFDSHTTSALVDKVAYNLVLWDTAGQDYYDRLRPLSYPHTDVFIICFALNNRPSLRRVTDKWWPEIKKNCPTAPILLLGTKSDLCRDPQGRETLVRGEEFIHRDEGEKVAKTIQAARYMECSAKTQRGVDKVFEEAVRITTRSRKPLPKKRRCFIL